MPALDTPDRTSYVNPDGTLTAQVFKSPVNYQDASGNWHRIDPTLSVQADGSIRDGGGPVGLRLAGSLGDANLVTMSDGSDAVTLGTPEQGSRPAGGGAFTGGVAAQLVKGAISNQNTVTYDNAWTGVDLESVSGLDAFTQLIVLAAPPAGAGDLVYRFPLSGHGLTPQLSSGGSLEFVDASGNVVFSSPSGEMSDNNVNPFSGSSPSDPLTYELGPGGAWVDIVASGSWLRDPARVYPVTIDPDVTQYAGASEAYITNTVPTGTFNYWYDTNLNPPDWITNIGYDYSAQSDSYWTLLNYNVSDLDGASIVSATWNGYFEWSSYCESTPYQVWRATSSWNPSTVTWNSQPSYSTSDGQTGYVDAHQGCVNSSWSSVPSRPGFRTGRAARRTTAS